MFGFFFSINMWVRQDNVRIVDIAVMNYVLVSRNVIGLLLHIRVL